MKTSTECYESFVSGENPIMFRVENGLGCAFPLASILHLRHEGNALTITLSTHDIQVTGGHLEKLLHELAHHRVSVLRTGRSADEIVIERIEVISMEAS